MGCEAVDEVGGGDGVGRMGELGKLGKLGKLGELGKLGKLVRLGKLIACLRTRTEGTKRSAARNICKAKLLAWERGPKGRRDQLQEIYARQGWIRKSDQLQEIYARQGWIR